MKRICVILLFSIVFAAASIAQVGIFDKQADWKGTSADEIKVAGSATIDNGNIIIEGNGDDIWGTEDEGFYLYTEKSGSYTLTAKAVWDIPGINEWGKMGLMIRDDGQAINSANYMLRERVGTVDSPADDVSAQWRRQAGIDSEATDAFVDADGNTIGDPGFNGIWMRVARNAVSNVCFASYSLDGVNWTQAHQIQVPMGDSVAYGLVITNHDDTEELVSAQFSDITLEEGAPLSAVRVLPKDRVSGGQTITVSIQIANPGVAQQMVITENVPEGWAISDVDNNGTVQGNQIKWDMNFPEGLTTLSYSAKGEPDAKIIWSGTVDGEEIAGPKDIVFLRARTPVTTGWNPPENGWLYIFDPDLGSEPDLEKDGWKHNNGSDSYVYQPIIPSGPNEGIKWENPGLIDDEEGGKCLVIYDPGDPRSMEVYGNIPDPSLRKVTISYDLGPVTKAVAAFRVRSKEFTDQFGVDIPFGYSENEGFCLLGLMLNTDMQDMTNYEGLSASGLFFSPDLPDGLNFPTFTYYNGNAVPGTEIAPWNNEEWHEYWITWNVTPGEKETALYVDGELTAKIAYPQDPNDDLEKQGAYFNKVRDVEGDIPAGDAMFRISFRQTGGAGNLQFDYICFAPDTDEPPSIFVPVLEWSLY